MGKEVEHLPKASENLRKESHNEHKKETEILVNLLEIINRRVRLKLILSQSGMKK